MSAELPLALKPRWFATTGTIAWRSSPRRGLVALGVHDDNIAFAEFAVEDLQRQRVLNHSLYETIYCARGEMENRIKEQQLGLFADRTSAAEFRSNQIRLYFSSIGYCVLEALRRLGLAGTKMARAQCTTIRLRLLKIGARIRITARKVWISLATGYPWAGEFEQVYANLERGEPLRC